MQVCGIEDFDIPSAREKEQSLGLLHHGSLGIVGRNLRPTVRTVLERLAHKTFWELPRGYGICARFRQGGSDQEAPAHKGTLKLQILGRYSSTETPEHTIQPVPYLMEHAWR